MSVWLIAALAMCIGAAAGLLGAGPSFFMLLLFIHVAGLDHRSAITTSLATVAMTSLVALVPYARGGDVLWRIGIEFGLTSMFGAYLGGRMEALIPSTVLVTLFLLAMMGAAITMLLKRPTSPNRRPRATKGRLSIVAIAGLLLGGLTGTVGLGGGFAVVPLLVAFLGAPMRAAVGTSLFVIAMNTTAGLAGHLGSRFPHPLDWRLAAIAGVSASAGSVVGARLGHRVDASVLRVAFAVLMLATAFALLASDIVSLERHGRVSW